MACKAMCVSILYTGVYRAVPLPFLEHLVVARPSSHNPCPSSPTLMSSSMWAVVSVAMRCLKCSKISPRYVQSYLIMIMWWIDRVQNNGRPIPIFQSKCMIDVRIKHEAIWPLVPCQ